MNSTARRWLYVAAGLAAILILFFVVKTAVRADTLTPVTASSGTEWGVIAVIAIVVAIGLFLWLKHRDPAAASALQTTAITDLKSVGEKIVAAIEKHTAAVAPAAAAATAEPPAPQAAAGKSGQAGQFTVAVTGDPTKDLPAITAAYYGS